MGSIEWFFAILFALFFHRFNLKRTAPDVPNLMCAYSGRISWVRSIESKLNEIMSLLKVTEYFNETNQLAVQLTIKFYNALSKDLVLYEAQQFKSWFDNVRYVFDMLNQPVIHRNSVTNRLQVNFDIKIWSAMEESKKMMKLHLGEFYFYIQGEPYKIYIYSAH